MKWSDLRRLAEEQLAVRAASKSRADQSAELMNYELRLHQVELEIQNEELRRIQLEMEERLSEYAARFDQSPIALVCHDRAGRISDVNRAAEAMLGIPRARLFDRPLHQFFSEADADRFHLHLRRAFERKIEVRSRLQVLLPDLLSFPALFSSRVTHDRCSTAIVDLTGTSPVRSTEELGALLDQFVQRAIAAIGVENGVAWLGGHDGAVSDDAVLSAPIIHTTGEAIGFFELHHKKDGSPFGPSDREKLGAIVRAASIALERALAQAKIRDAEEELKGADRRQADFLAALPRATDQPLASIRPAIGDLLGDAPRTAKPRAGVRILVVDDNEDAATSLGMLLSLKGHDVSTATDGYTAIERARTETPDVIFMDVGMPQMDGIETASRIRALEECRSVYIVALTGWSQPADRKRTRAAGIDHHLAKPASDADLESALALYHLRSAQLD